MARRFTTSLVFLTLLACGLRASAQSTGSKPIESGSADTATSLALGQSMVPLYGPWKFHVGDSPVEPVTGQLLWATPGFDDSAWETVDLTPKEAANPFRGSSGYVPGWAERGHPGYWGYAWYRIRVKIKAEPGEKLALAGPANFDDAYQLFPEWGAVGKLRPVQR